MTTALVVSGRFVANQWEHATMQRLGTQVEALARVVDRIDCLLLVKSYFTPENLRAYEDHLRRFWTAKLSLRVAQVRPGPAMTGWQARWQAYGPGVFDFYAQQLPVPSSHIGAYRDLTDEATVAVVRAALRAGPDLIFAHRLEIMALFMRLSRDVGRTPVFFDLDDIGHIALSRRLLRCPDWPMERLRLMQIPRLLLAEIQAIRRSRLTFVCSDQDCRYLRRLARSRRVEVVVNSTRFPASVRAGAPEPVVLFVGYLGYQANALAADVLVRDIWPKVRTRVPHARVIVAGRLFPELLRSYPSTDPSVTFTGYVENLHELYEQARVFCCPILNGAGTRLKIIEAAAHARAIVSTTLGAEGLDFENGTEIILRDGVAPLADECVRLLQDPAAAKRIGIAAREKARSTYEHDAVVGHLERLFRGGLHSGREEADARPPGCAS
jgi:glycosyltransferase involved in cell wall biosynthesis